MKAKIIISITILSCFLWQSCSKGTVIKITDFTKPEVYNVNTEQYENVIGTTFDLKGNVNGRIGITSLGCSGRFEFSGKIDTTIRCDCYSYKSLIAVMPLTATTGHLTINFRFSKL